MKERLAYQRAIGYFRSLQRGIFIDCRLVQRGVTKEGILIKG